MVVQPTSHIFLELLLTANGNAVVIEKIENFTNSNISIPQETNLIEQESPVILPKSNPVVSYCPKCGIPMEIVIANKGKHLGKNFYVCPNYKECKQIFPVE